MSSGYDVIVIGDGSPGRGGLCVALVEHEWVASAPTGLCGRGREAGCERSETPVAGPKVRVKQ